ncbi:hypothetical protein BN2476_490093 [Paraburkholderia piptadeniae]|uniref:Uncharacterized protein n=1 Tax=Paraburkholderia piptadeniae TaxID=1701573 RepID=A0A1N7SF05_9BURK|nr:hypothetical protein [Paraburkholderia piptadeniae]SIT45988.1 hypothetical protein BN2476_490093 [Paraburkholderia piptadeniae]
MDATRSSTRCAHKWPQDTLNRDERDIRDGFLLIDPGKTKKKLRLEVTGELKTVIDRIKARIATYKVVSAALEITETGQRMTLRTRSVPVQDSPGSGWNSI